MKTLIASLPLNLVAVETLDGCSRGATAYSREYTSAGVRTAARRPIASNSFPRFWDEPRKRTFRLVALAHLIVILSVWRFGI